MSLLSSLGKLGSKRTTWFMLKVEEERALAINDKGFTSTSRDNYVCCECMQQGTVVVVEEESCEG